MSDACARPIPAAAARLSTPGRPSIDSCVSQPASAMYPRASAASVALNCVVAPNSRAVSSSCASWSPVAPDRAATFDIDDSNAEPTSYTPCAKSPTADIADENACAPMLPMKVPAATAQASRLPLRPPALPLACPRAFSASAPSDLTAFL